MVLLYKQGDNFKDDRNIDRYNVQIIDTLSSRNLLLLLKYISKQEMIHK